MILPEIPPETGFMTGVIIKYDRTTQLADIKLANGGVEKNIDLVEALGNANTRQGLIVTEFDGNRITKLGTVVFVASFGGAIKIIATWGGFKSWAVTGTKINPDGSKEDILEPKYFPKLLEGELKLNAIGVTGAPGGYVYFQQNGDVDLRSSIGVNGISVKNNGDVTLDGFKLSLNGVTDIEISNNLGNIKINQTTGEVKLSTGLSSISLTADGSITLHGRSVKIGGVDLINWLNQHGHMTLGPVGPTSKASLPTLPCTPQLPLIMTPEI